MNIEAQNDNEITLLKLEGNLDGTTAEYAQETILGYVSPNHYLIIDMEKCLYVSSAGLRVLLITAKQLAKIGGKGVFVNLTEEVHDVMEMTGFSAIFDRYETIDEAKQAIRKG